MGMTLDDSAAASHRNDDYLLTLNFGSCKLRQSSILRAPKCLTKNEVDAVKKELERRGGDEPIQRSTDVN